MADKITCCPYCNTSFRVTDAHLQSAKGAVRCGSCLKIFRAADHLLDTSTHKPRPAQPATDTPLPNEEKVVRYRFDPEKWDDAYQDAEADLDDDSVLISDDMGATGEGLGDFSEDFLQRSRDKNSSLFERAPKIKDDDDLDTSDESWAEDLLSDDDWDDDPKLNSDTTSNPPDTVEAPDTEPKAHTSTDTDTLSVKGAGDFGDLIDIPPSPAPQSSVHTRKKTAPSRETTDEPMDALVTGESERISRSHSREEMIKQIKPEPVNFLWKPEPSPWPKRMLWGGLSLLALITLVIQLTAYNFSSLSRSESLRPLLTQVCDAVNCEMPSLNAPEKVKTYNLVVRSHPEVENALIIDSILLNTAPFEQAFPDFELTFSGMDGKAIATRRFTPKEYLAGELAGAVEMPSGQPVHISLEILDPGSEAVNYTASIPLESRQSSPVMP